MTRPVTDHIKLTPDGIGWKLTITTILPEVVVEETFEIGDATQFHGEVDRTIGRWLADGPRDFHNADSTEPQGWHERPYPLGNLKEEDSP